MVTTVNDAFEEFLAKHVNLDPQDTSDARTSRDWLLRQIHSLPERDSTFPILCTDFDIHYGSFARRTKTGELDDLDMIVGISALGTTYLDDGGTIRLTVPDGIALRKLCHDGTALLNSRRVINKFVDQLEDVPQYQNSELKRNGSAAVLNLVSYPWRFDIVPGFFTTPESNGRTYYIIPDGNGHWMKTDPRIDRERTTNINQAHNGNVLNVIRTMKYWNSRGSMPTMSSYLLECIVLNYYEHKTNTASAFVDLEVEYFLPYLANAVFEIVQDPKQIQGNINNMGWSDRQAVSLRATTDTQKARAAREAEIAKNYEASINIWREIFGSTFPEFG